MSVTVRPYITAKGKTRWETDLRVLLPNGKVWRERKRPRVATKDAASRWGQHRERELIRSGPPKKPKEVPTLRDFQQRFIDEHPVANRHKPSGIAQKETVFRVHLIPSLGDTRLDEISNEDVQRLKHALREKSVKTVNNVLTVLSTTLKKAVEWNVIERMPCTVRLLKTSLGSAKCYSFEEFHRLIAAAAELDPRAHLVVLLGGDAGLRAGEMRALAWEDINFAKSLLRVEHSEWRGTITTTKGNRIRYVRMTRRLSDALRQHRHLKGPLVLYREDGTPMTANALCSLLERSAKRAGVPVIGPHALRHTFCSHLAMRGAPARAIQELAGHKDLQTTQRYMHLSPAALDDAIGLLERPRPQEGRGEIRETGTAPNEN